MPIDKETGEKICLNGCGLLQQAKVNRPDFMSHFIPSLVHQFISYEQDKTLKQKEIVVPEVGLGYALEIWVCPKCRYIELYDFDLGEK